MVNDKKPPLQHRKRWGFTLIELLVTFGAICAGRCMLGLSHHQRTAFAVAGAPRRCLRLVVSG